MLRKTGFSDVALVVKTSFNSSPKTEGALIRASKD
jgi:hypothetical protein